MKTRVKILEIILIVLVGWISAPAIVHADVDWTVLKEINLGAQPLDVATSADGKLVFVLTPGEILVYSISEEKVTNRIPMDEGFDRVTYSEKHNAVFLTNSTSKTLKIVQVDLIYKIALSGLPFKGPEDAPVTIAAFDDYQ